MELQSSRLPRPYKYVFSRLSSRIVNWRDQLLDPSASTFYRAMSDSGFDPDAHIDVLPRHRVIYISLPKCASTTIKSILSTLVLGTTVALDKVHKRRYSGLMSPTHVGLSTFHRLANGASTLRFSFVRNPYARLVSAWADKFQGKPIVAGDTFIDQYRAHRAAISEALPDGEDETLSFAQFVEFAAATADRRLNAHWQLQDDMLTMPGIKLDFIGKVEFFHRDFTGVLDHVRACDKFRQKIDLQLNPSKHRPWQDYYTDALAARVYRAYQRDFERFGYPRMIAAAV